MCSSATTHPLAQSRDVPLPGLQAVAVQVPEESMIWLGITAVTLALAIGVLLYRLGRIDGR